MKIEAFSGAFPWRSSKGKWRFVYVALFTCFTICYGVNSTSEVGPDSLLAPAAPRFGPC